MVCCNSPVDIHQTEGLRFVAAGLGMCCPLYIRSFASSSDPACVVTIIEVYVGRPSALHRSCTPLTSSPRCLVNYQTISSMHLWKPKYAHGTLYTEVCLMVSKLAGAIRPASAAIADIYITTWLCYHLHDAKTGHAQYVVLLSISYW